MNAFTFGAGLPATAKVGFSSVIEVEPDIEILISFKTGAVPLPKRELIISYPSPNITNDEELAFWLALPFGLFRLVHEIENVKHIEKIKIIVINLFMIDTSPEEREMLKY